MAPGTLLGIAACFTPPEMNRKEAAMLAEPPSSSTGRHHLVLEFCLANPYASSRFLHPTLSDRTLQRQREAAWPRTGKEVKCPSTINTEIYH